MELRQDNIPSENQSNVLREDTTTQKITAASAGYTATWIRINHAERRSINLIEKEEKAGA